MMRCQFFLVKTHWSLWFYSKPEHVMDSYWTLQGLAWHCPFFFCLLVLLACLTCFHAVRLLKPCGSPVSIFAVRSGVPPFSPRYLSSSLPSSWDRVSLCISGCPWIWTLPSWVGLQAYINMPGPIPLRHIYIMEFHVQVSLLWNNLEILLPLFVKAFSVSCNFQSVGTIWVIPVLLISI